uniref:Uncharacterized protein n=1 Tax=Nelumbo nucifera TaxID=4432 RepID=A0A822XZK4_NELNU|nr:TPA_asm: hypothetical protein HUJ06_025698 [Nelumbo nucifera]
MKKKKTLFSPMAQPYFRIKPAITYEIFSNDTGIHVNKKS